MYDDKINELVEDVEALSDIGFGVTNKTGNGMANMRKTIEIMIQIRMIRIFNGNPMTDLLFFKLQLP